MCLGVFESGSHFLTRLELARLRHNPGATKSHLSFTCTRNEQCISITSLSHSSYKFTFGNSMN